MRLSLRRRAHVRAEPPTEPLRVQSAAPWRPLTEVPDVGMLIEVRAPRLGPGPLRARYQQGFQGTHWLLAITGGNRITTSRWVDLNHLTGWRYL